MESVTPPQTIPRYPVPRSSTHVYTAPSGGKPAAVTHRSRTGSLSSEDEYDRDHIPPYLPPLPLEAEDQKGNYYLHVQMHNIIACVSFVFCFICQRKFKDCHNKSNQRVPFFSVFTMYTYYAITLPTLHPHSTHSPPPTHSPPLPTYCPIIIGILYVYPYGNPGHLHVSQGEGRGG